MQISPLFPFVSISKEVKVFIFIFFLNKSLETMIYVKRKTIWALIKINGKYKFYLALHFKLILINSVKIMRNIHSLNINYKSIKTIKQTEKPKVKRHLIFLSIQMNKWYIYKFDGCLFLKLFNEESKVLVLLASGVRPNSICIYLHCNLDPWLILLSTDFQSPIHIGDLSPPKEKGSGLFGEMICRNT